MVQTTKLAGGTLYNYGISDFDLQKVMSETVDNDKSNLPYQCLPIYLNSDDALDRVKYQAVSTSLDGNLYVPDNVDDSNIVWVLFRGLMGDILDSSMGMTEWEQYLFNSSDFVLPVNFQVGNHQDTPEQFKNYEVSQYNCYAKPLAHNLRRRFFTNGLRLLQPDDFKRPFGYGHTQVNAGPLKPDEEVYITDQGPVKMRFNFSSGDYNGEKQVYYAQLGTYHYSDDNHSYHDYRYFSTPNPSNTLDIYCYDGRIEAYFLVNKVLPWSKFLNQMGQIYNQILFDNDDLDTYVSDLNQYLDDDADSNSILSNYIDNQAVQTKLNTAVVDSNARLKLSWMAVIATLNVLTVFGAFLMFGPTHTSAASNTQGFDNIPFISGLLNSFAGGIGWFSLGCIAANIIGWHFYFNTWHLINDDGLLPTLRIKLQLQMIDFQLTAAKKLTIVTLSGVISMLILPHFNVAILSLLFLISYCAAVVVPPILILNMLLGLKKQLPLQFNRISYPMVCFMGLYLLLLIALEAVISPMIIFIGMIGPMSYYRWCIADSFDTSVNNVGIDKKQPRQLRGDDKLFDFNADSIATWQNELQHHSN